MGGLDPGGRLLPVRSTPDDLDARTGQHVTDRPQDGGMIVCDDRSNGVALHRRVTGIRIRRCF
jgi:hypothetical protein